MHIALILAAAVLVLAGCSSDASSPSGSSSSSSAGGSASTTGGSTTGSSTATSGSAGSRTYRAEVWADNWFEMYVNGAVVGTDSVSITTERSFNKESFTFTASVPFTIGIQGKDYMKDESGLEYIGTDRQQMGDGGLIAQITDTATGRVVVATGAAWKTFVVQQAPLNITCEKSPSPSTDCQSKRVAEPAGWSGASFDASGWSAATAYTEAQVSPKDGYTEVKWDSSAKLIWGTSLKTDNIVLFRTVVAG